MSEECSVEHLGGVLADPTARHILEASHREAVSAEELSDVADVSKPTVYRRIEDIQVCDLLREETALDPDGHHYAEFRTDLERIIVELDEDGFAFELERREPMADRFTRLIEEM